MRTRKLNLKSSFFNLLGYVGGARHGQEHTTAQVEQLRQAMLEVLGESGAAAHPMVARQLRFADDVIDLWYARTELMAALADQLGESHAREHMARLGLQFAALLPPGMTAAAQRARR